MAIPISESYHQINICRSTRNSWFSRERWKFILETYSRNTVWYSNSRFLVDILHFYLICFLSSDMENPSFMMGMHWYNGSTLLFFFVYYKWCPLVHQLHLNISISVQSKVSQLIRKRYLLPFSTFSETEVTIPWFTNIIYKVIQNFRFLKTCLPCCY